MSPERKPRWYWVKLSSIGPWVPAAIIMHGNWCCHGRLIEEDQFSVIGPRIPTPDEAAEPTLEQLIERQAVKPLKSISQLEGLMGDDPE